MSKSEAFCIDCMEGMKQYPDKYFDIAIVDPPYGGVTQGGYMRNNKSCARLAKERDYNTELWNQSKPGADYFHELFRVSKNQIIWGGNYFVEEIQRNSQCWLVWDKCHPAGVGFADVELAWTSYDRASRIFRFLWNGMLQGQPGAGEKMQGNKKKNEPKIHPTQKPVSLYTWILHLFAEPGMKLLDTHLGSGSSRIAAFDVNLDFVGFEISKTYFELQEERFARHARQLNIFLQEDTP